MMRVNCGLLISIFGFPLVVAAAGGFSGDSLVYAVAASVVTGLATILVAAPLLVWCRRRKCLSIWPFIAGGLCAGFVFSLPVTLFAWPFMIFFAAAGGLIGAVFWLIAVYHNPRLHEWRAFSKSTVEDVA